MRHPRPSAHALLGTILLALLGSLLLAPPVALRAQASTDLAHGSRAAGAVEKGAAVNGLAPGHEKAGGAPMNRDTPGFRLIGEAVG